MGSMKTIRQIADEIGVTKQAVHQKIKKEPLSTDLRQFISMTDNVIYISEQGETLIKSAFSQRVSMPVDADKSKFTETVDVNRMVDLLQEQLNIMRQQLDVKDKQIDDLQADKEFLRQELDDKQRTIDAAQLLHAGTMQKQLTDGSSPEKVSLWSKLFRKKNGE